ncbi:uncharacterized protein LOC108631806, partial [Ceratina calcarata]|uniref:Uncharacterized protein LOC108631806 n=1 Tax=Ceratina calcarata TaxID=156304 RepID=A0AAJ7NEM9_9HYME
PIKIATRANGQFTLNMLRRTILVLQLYGLLAACYGTVLYRDFHVAESIPIDCDRGANFTGCATRVQEIEDKGNQSMVNTDETITNEVTDETDETLEVTGRRKKNRGYGQILLYFLGASKLTMLYVIINAVAAIAGKALIVAKVALAIATAIALKKASEHKEKVSYEIIKHPHHSFEHTHSSSIDYDHHGFGEGDYNYRKRRRIL